ncbi:ATP-binding protein [Sphingomonas sp. CFBP 13733]|uniref:ATP-binding protein n=1 Tax=Sphingomonas sp. CFBP 13733 TaxID=2775291 RepID=UPI001786DC82|nr:ATP-binding protein [Sphingomonas sp. CFBP 13733]MBD8638196.1 ATP-binding protein [Sphingomonas sp. CFBP 13733]
MATQEHFRVSSHLKDVIGRDLVTNEFVAVFELVKNAFDASASKVDIAFDNDARELWIVDDGKGMDEQAIRDKWLFVAYSAKADGTEDAGAKRDYRDRIRPQGQYAGSKGIGRFSCDTLGEVLALYTRTTKGNEVQKLSVQWEKFEADSKQLFQKIGVRLEEVDGFPTDAPISMPQGPGTILRISSLRGSWHYDDIFRLRRYLEKLIDPFGTTDDTPVYISVKDSELSRGQITDLDGPVGNNIRDLLSDKTTKINVLIENGKISTTLTDRGRVIYKITERSEFEGLLQSAVRMELFYLNRSAKHTFTARMGVRSVEFGSVFLFLNGFRIFPIGEENDDTFGLNRRKQQGSARYLGTRDLMGRVDVSAPTRMFREASSRDAGLIEDARVRDLYEAVKRKAIFRLERYVVGVTWMDAADADRDDASGLSLAPTRSRVVQLIGQLAASKAVEIEYYDPEITELFDAEAKSIEGTFKSLSIIAERRGDNELLRSIEAARARQVELEASEREAAEAAREARAAKAYADERIARLEQQATYLASTQDMTVEQMTLLLHQVMIYAGHIGSAVDRALGNARVTLEAAADLAAGGDDEDLLDAAASIRTRTRRMVDDLDYIHLENDRLTAVARFASNARFDLETDLLQGDIVEFLDEYVNQVRAGRDGASIIAFQGNSLSQVTRFRPVDLVVVVDNLLDNARKHGARQLTMTARRKKGTKLVEVLICDDGRGIDEQRVDPARLFEKGYTSGAGGTGLGLYHSRKVMDEMGGDISLDVARDSGRADFVMTLPGPKA